MYAFFVDTLHHIQYHITSFTKRVEAPPTPFWRGISSDQTSIWSGGLADFSFNSDLHSS